MKIVTFYEELLRLAREEAKARESGDPERLKRAQFEHEQYRQLCLKADEMIIPPTQD